MKLLLLIITITIIIGGMTCWAKKDPRRIPEIRAIMGEARCQGYDGMYAVACAIRNRGNLRGVYGLKDTKIDLEPDSVWKIAVRAWHDSEKGEDVTLGATSWENVEQFGKPWWAKSMIKTVKIGAHTFYKEK